MTKITIQDTFNLPIRIITTGSMQRRFTLAEELEVLNDPTASVIRSRLFNASYCDLDLIDTVEGISYICGMLESSGTIEDAQARTEELLANGTEAERV